MELDCGNSTVASVGVNLTVKRLISTFPRIAIDGAEVWKTVALVYAARCLRATVERHVVLAALSQLSVLLDCGRSVKVSERLPGTLKPGAGEAIDFFRPIWEKTHLWIAFR